MKLDASVFYTVEQLGCAACVNSIIQVRSKDSQVKTHLVLWIPILLKVTR